MIVSTIVLFTFSCESRISNAELSEQWWKYCGGVFPERDILEFSAKKPSNLTDQNWLSGDTLYEGLLPTAIITGTETRLDGTISLDLENLLTGDSTCYCGKGTK